MVIFGVVNGIQEVEGSTPLFSTRHFLVAISPMATIFFLILPIFFPIQVIFGQIGLFLAVSGMMTIERTIGGGDIILMTTEKRGIFSSPAGSANN